MERQVTKMSGNLITLVGTELKVGEQAPDFELRNVDFDLKTLNDFQGKIKFISAVPSIDTSVCDYQAKTINEWGGKYPAEVVFLNISMDLPFAQKRWCIQSDARQVLLLSDSVDASFGTNYGILIKELRLLNRAIFILDKDNLIRYMEIVPENTNPPNIELAFQALKSLVPST
jgi:thiol peroxidase